MTSAEVYRWLTSGGQRAVCEQFDAHVVAAVISLGLVESGGGAALCEALGLAPEQLRGLVDALFPHAAVLYEGLDPALRPTLAEDELCLQHLLERSSSERTPLQLLLASIIARRAQRPNHLWQDLGLRNRRELSWLMARHFEPLATRNAQEMKWKKFLYRMICRDQGFLLCTAPSCSECDDFDGCFGDESGESLLALTRREDEQASQALSAQTQAEDEHAHL